MTPMIEQLTIQLLKLKMEKEKALIALCESQSKLAWSQKQYIDEKYQRLFS